ncbi:chordin-like protein 1 [Schistocerca gregaria]|uniref:chordin-like protein 1 n=1 Tax=Schistocerca gregaria TaxID=7010 RepID=UPI00211DE312|nr:chordin-like protein 1 [Schistocerca gregaria]
MVVSLCRLLLAAFLTCSLAGVDGRCKFGLAEYELGERWFPRLESQGTVFCVTCGCYEGGRMNCSSRACPVNCSKEENADCCRICSEHEPQTEPAPPQPAPGAEGEQQRPAGAEEGEMAAAPSTIVGRDGDGDGGCVHNKRAYRNGESFPSNSTGLRVDQPNQCVQCKCTEGVVICETQTCPPLDCSSPVSTASHCCPVCPGPLSYNQQSSSITFSDPSAPSGRKDRNCISTGKYYVDGSSWHPVIGPFGPMDCVRCHCLSGSIECSRFKCPSREELPCEKPVKQFGQCCASCPVPAMSVLRQGDVSEVGSAQCLPKGSELAVYRVQGTKNLSNFIQYAFQGLEPSKCEVQLHSWVVRNGAAESFETQTVSGGEFTKMRQKLKFIPLGATTIKHLNKFSRREKKLKKRCTNNCISKVLRLEDSFNLVKVQFRKACQVNELQLRSV